jgi:hypothetical protein
MFHKLCFNMDISPVHAKHFDKEKFNDAVASQDADRMSFTFASEAYASPGLVVNQPLPR